MSGKKTTEEPAVLTVEQFQEEFANLEKVNQELLAKVAELETEIQKLKVVNASAENRVVGSFTVNGRVYTFKKGILSIRHNGKLINTQELLDNAEKNSEIFENLVQIGSKSIKVVNQ